MIVGWVLSLCGGVHCNVGLGFCLHAGGPL